MTRQELARKDSARAAGGIFVFFMVPSCGCWARRRGCDDSTLLLWCKKRIRALFIPLTLAALLRVVSCVASPLRLRTKRASSFLRAGANPPLLSLSNLPPLIAAEVAAIVPDPSAADDASHHVTTSNKATIERGGRLRNCQVCRGEVRVNRLNAGKGQGKKRHGSTHSRVTPNAAFESAAVSN